MQMVYEKAIGTLFNAYEYCREALFNHLWNTDTQLFPSEARRRSVLESTVFDTIRYLLPGGARTRRGHPPPGSRGARPVREPPPAADRSAGSGRAGPVPARPW